MNCQKVTQQIVDWMKGKVSNAKLKGFVVGVSGGIDSALVSMLCAKTGIKTVLIQLPINRKESDIPIRAENHCKMLSSNFENIQCYKHDLSIPYNQFLSSINFMEPSELAKSNLASRMRMCSLYTFANTFNCLVAGTGNKVEDYGCGFFTKGGDGCVDISPIGDLLKSEVRELAKYLGVSDEIVNAVPTDELWADTRSDESQIGASYDELEWAMKVSNDPKLYCELFNNGYSDRQKQVLQIYTKRHESNAHKMVMPPVCELNKN